MYFRNNGSTICNLGTLSVIMQEYMNDMQMNRGMRRMEVNKFYQVHQTSTVFLILCPEWLNTALVGVKCNAQTPQQIAVSTLQRGHLLSHSKLILCVTKNKEV